MSDHVNKHQVNRLIIQALRRLNIPFMCNGVLVGNCDTCGGQDETTNLLTFDTETNTLTSTVNGVISTAVLEFDDTDVFTTVPVIVAGITYLPGTALSVILPALANPAPSGYIRELININSDTTAGATPFTDYYYFVAEDTTLILPTAVGNKSRYTVKNVGSSGQDATVRIQPSLGQKIESEDFYEIYFINNSRDIASDGSNWRII